MKLAALRYYLAALPTWIGQVENWTVAVELLLRRTPVIVRLKSGCQLKARTLMDLWIIKETCLDREYEAHSVPLQDGWTVIDIGAGLGDFVVSVAHAHPRSQIYAYEPFPESFALLQENIALNAVRNVRAFPLAVGAAAGTLSLALNDEAVQHTTTGHRKAGAAIPATAVSLDMVFQQNALTRCDFLKIDCEGGEFDILFNAGTATLDATARVCLEYHDGFTRYAHSELSAYLQQQGFQVKVMPNQVHPFLGMLYAWREN